MKFFFSEGKKTVNMRGGVVNQTVLNDVVSAAEQAVMKVCDSVGEAVIETVNHLLAQEQEVPSSTITNRISTSVTR